jgi:hypothetical protein
MIKSFQSKQKCNFIKKQIKQMDLTSKSIGLALSGGDQKVWLTRGP